METKFFAERGGENNKGVETKTLDELFIKFGLSVETAKKLYGDHEFRNFLELDDNALKTLEQDQAVRILSRRNVVPYTEMQGFTLKRQAHEALFTAIRSALCGRIPAEVQLPVVILKKDTSIIAVAHELTHATKKESLETTNLHDYINSPNEREAFINSILLYRLKNPAKTFYDFAIEQENASKEKWHDVRIEKLIKEGSGRHLNIEKEIWESSGLGAIDEDNIVDIKDSLLRKYCRDNETLTEKLGTAPVEKRKETTIAQTNQLESMIVQMIKEKKKQEAIEAGLELYHSYLQLDPTYGAYRLGSIYEAFGELDKARGYYQEAIDYNKQGYFYHEKALSRLEKI